MKSQSHPYDRRELKEVLHRNELTDELKDMREWAQNHLEVVLVCVLLVAALVFGVYFFLNGRKQRELAASMLLNQAQEAFSQAVEGPPDQAAQGYAQAYFKYQSLLGAYPGSLQFRAAELGLANADLALGKGADAQKEYAGLDDGKAGDPISALGALGEARALEQQGEDADARAAYAAVLSRYPGSAVVGEAKAGQKLLAEAAPVPASAPSAPLPAPSLPAPLPASLPMSPASLKPAPAPVAPPLSPPPGR